jgi:hypothetical protein
MAEGNNFGEAYNEAYEIKNSALGLKAERREKGEPTKEDYMKAEHLLREDRADQEAVDDKRKLEIKEKLLAINWKEFWKNEGLESPTRNDVFSNGEDERMSDEEVVESLNRYFEKQKSDLFNMTGIDSEEFPEIIDRDIRAVCQKLNRLPFLKTREGCGGHEKDRVGESSNIGYSEPYLTFYAQEENPKFIKLKEQLDDKLEQFKKADLPGIKNVVVNGRKEDWPIKTKGVGMYRYDMRIVPTQEWCEDHNKEYISRPISPGSYPDWCQEKGFEYSEEEESASRQKWDEAKKKYWKEVEKFGIEYGEYFRSDEARKLRDEFFKVFEVDVIPNKEKIMIDSEQEIGKLTTEIVERVEKSRLETFDKVNFLLTKLGLKPASVLEIPIQLKALEEKDAKETSNFSSEQDMQEIIEMISSSGLKSQSEIRIINASYRSRQEPESGKYFEGEWKSIEIFIANNQENLEKISKAWKSDDIESIGKVLGFPKTAVEAYSKKEDRLYINELPAEIVEANYAKFASFTLSKNNWQEELETAKKWADAIRKNSPNLYREIIGGE